MTENLSPAGSHEGRYTGTGVKKREEIRASIPLLPNATLDSLTKDGLINKSITHDPDAPGMNAYQEAQDRDDFGGGGRGGRDKIGGCPRGLVLEQRGVRHGINVCLRDPA